jgi:hypothetical protein
VPNLWFRMYAEFANDPKVQRMSEAMQRRLVMLFCARCSDALVTLRDEDVAFHWRISEAELAETKVLFIAKGFIDEKWNLLNWNKRQYISDSSSERTRRYRERKRTSQQTTGDGFATLFDGHCDGLDTDTDTEADSEADSEETEAVVQDSLFGGGRENPVKSLKETSAYREPEPRHAEFKAALTEYWVAKNSIAMPWDGSEGKALSQFLLQNPHVSVEQFGAMLRNRAQSEGVNHGDRPRLLLSRITSYTNGPLDRFNRPRLSTQPRRLQAVNQ